MEDVLVINTEENVIRKIEPYTVLGETNPLLKKVIDPFNGTLEEAQELSERLIETLKAHNGLGLAANQCGIDKRVICILFGESFLTLFNPVIKTSGGEIHLQEGCLSFPFLVLGITRPEKIVVGFSNFKGEYIEETFTGLTARVIQHEIDHLNGVTFDTRAKPLALKKGMKKREKLVKNFVINNLIRSTQI